MNEEKKLPTLFDQISSMPSKDEGNESKSKKEMNIRDKLRKKKQAEKQKDVKDSTLKENSKEQEKPTSIQIENKNGNENEINSIKDNKKELILLDDRINKDNLDIKNEEAIKDEIKIEEKGKNEENLEKKISLEDKEDTIKNNIEIKIDMIDSDKKVNEDNNNELRKIDTINETIYLMKN